MPTNITDIMQQFASSLRKLLGNTLDSVIVYGSYARGDYGKNSDIDIMILTDFNDEELAKYRMKIRDLACDLELENDIIISPTVRNIEKYNNRIIKKIIKEIKKERLAVNFTFYSPYSFSSLVRFKTSRLYVSNYPISAN